ncbi:hypothetical protein PR048_029776 [Dryococelus australis]|uniref:Uncharacterized protein n=1 Tax=Dryococelus australis TaxID=614101 RepID=A0ABQ9G739_9NEOP|nr:hypothetical protein PR048_029776 [Dryococelus australis]
MFYATQHKVRQDNIIHRFTQTSLTKRKRNLKDCYEKDVSVKYYLVKKVGKNAYNQANEGLKEFVRRNSVLKKHLRRIDGVMYGVPIMLMGKQQLGVSYKSCGLFSHITTGARTPRNSIFLVN